MSSNESAEVLMKKGLEDKDLDIEMDFERSYKLHYIASTR